MSEEWRVIPSFPNYEASNTGKIRRIKNNKEIKLFEACSRGYKTAYLYSNKKKYTKKAARLIWEAFNGCPCDKTIDHIDRNTGNNNIDNLRCISLQENLQNKTIYKGKNKYDLTIEKKKQIITEYRTGQKSTWRLMKEYNIPINYLDMVFKRGSWDYLYEQQ
jgi:hypothetical protein